MPANGYSAPAPARARRDPTGLVVTIGMLLLTLIGVVSVFHQPIAALLFTAPASGEPPTTAEERGAPAPVLRQH